MIPSDYYFFFQIFLRFRFLKRVCLTNAQLCDGVIVRLIYFGTKRIFNMAEQKTHPAGRRVRLVTSLGDMVIELYADMPVTAGNFESLIEKGFYNGIIFHRVIAGFMIQGGDPTGTGTGGPGYTIKDEFTSANQNNRGTIAMANAGPNTGGSQFFINLVDNNYLDRNHPVFGKVVEGMDTVDKIGKVRTDRNDRPLQSVKILSATIT
jgi:peptidylprolyl isomerase